MAKIIVKYFDTESININRLEKTGEGEWIDIGTGASSVVLRKGIYTRIKSGIAVKLPEGYEAIILPRSSTFKRWGVHVVPAVIDNSYRKRWIISCYPTKDVVIPANTNIAQFRIQKIQDIEIEEGDFEDTGRGGFGSTDSYLYTEEKENFHVEEDKPKEEDSVVISEDKEESTIEDTTISHDNKIISEAPHTELMKDEMVQMTIEDQDVKDILVNVEYSDINDAVADVYNKVIEEGVIEEEEEKKEDDLLIDDAAIPEFKFGSNFDLY